jgi:predicted oxidoreductase
MTLTSDTPDLSPMIAGYWRLQQWGFSTQQLLSFIEQHIALGISTVDHAWVYQSEAIFGRALKQAPELRRQLQIISKCGIKPPGNSRLHARNTAHYDSRGSTIIESCEQSLRDLNTDHLDMLLLHRPDYLMPVDEVASAFNRLKETGKVKHFGVSNFSVAQFELLRAAVDVPLVTNQIEFSPYQLSALESGVLEQSQIQQFSVMAWSCLGGGDLLKGETERSQRLLLALTDVMRAVGADSIDQVVYAWVLAHPAKILPLLGSSNIERYRSAVKALHITIEHEQWYSIWQAAVGHSVA